MIKRAKLAVLAIAALALAVGGIFGPSPAAAQEDKYKVFVSVGFEGNTWMDAAQNLISAMARPRPTRTGRSSTCNRPGATSRPRSSRSTP